MALDDNKKPLAFESLTVKETIDGLQTDKEKGLTSQEAKERLEKFGQNKLKEKKRKSWIQIFFEQMANPMIYVLFAAIAVTIGVSIYETVMAAKAGWVVNGVTINNPFLEVGDWPDVIIIVAVIIMNSVIGTIQEVKAATSLEALKRMSSPESVVIRDGKKIKVKSSDLVIGDIVYLEEGDTIGADIRLIEAVNLKANESSLTGESVPVEKDASLTFSSEVGIGDRKNMVYMSTPVAYGRGCGVVVATGMDTQIGKIASALDEEEEETPLQKTLAKLSKFLGILTLIIIAVVLVVDVIWLFVDGTATSVEAWIEAVLSAIALAVAAIPEGLAAVVTIVLSIGVQRMVKANTIVRKLPSVETLGSVSVVCSDKTGTLTQNKMTVLEAYVDHSFHVRDEFKEDSKNDTLRLLAKGMSLCSNATFDESGAFGDPTEICLVEMANLFGMPKNMLEKETPRIDELPFDSVRKMMSTKHQEKDGVIVYTKGALDSIIKGTTYILDNGKERKITKEDVTKIFEANTTFSSKALRVLALAYKKVDEEKISEEGLTFVGLVAMIDPPRIEAKPAVETFKRAGIVTIMITGDHKDTAFAIAKELGIASDINQCYTGQDVDKMSEAELQETCKTARVFARVSPENKVQIVKAFKANGNICAMTGDGVNDAPSLKAADIGIAMGITGTDVAKGAADMVLTDDNFASIEKAVEEGRGIYANIKKTVIFLLSSNIAEVLAMLFIIIIGLPAPLIAIHLLWVNLATDSLPAIALGMDKKDPNNMKEKPREANENLFSHGGYKRTFFYGAVITVAVILAYFMPAWLNGTVGIANVKALYEADAAMKGQAQTMAFTALAFSELFHMLGMSNPDRSFVHVFKSGNWMMLLAFFFGFGLQLLVIEIPGVRTVFSTTDLNWQEWLWLALFSVLPLLVHEIIVLIKSIIKKAKERKAK